MWYNEIKWHIHSLQLSSNTKETCRAMWNVFVLRVLWTPPWFWQWPLWCRRVLSPGCFVSASTFQTPNSKKRWDSSETEGNTTATVSNSENWNKPKNWEDKRLQHVSMFFSQNVTARCFKISVQRYYQQPCWNTWLDTSRARFPHHVPVKDALMKLWLLSYCSGWLKINYLDHSPYTNLYFSCVLVCFGGMVDHGWMVDQHGNVVDMRNLFLVSIQRPGDEPQGLATHRMWSGDVVHEGCSRQTKGASTPLSVTITTTRVANFGLGGVVLVIWNSLRCKAKVSRSVRLRLCTCITLHLHYMYYTYCHILSHVMESEVN